MMPDMAGEKPAAYGQEGLSSRLVVLKVARGRPGALPSWTEHRLEAEPGMTLLDALEAIRSGTARTKGGKEGEGPLAATELRYRHSCHHGSCGTCGAIVNGRERLMCLVPLEEFLGSPDGKPGVTVEPLRRMAVVGDLAVDPSPLFSELPAETSYLRASEVVHKAPREEDPDEACFRLEACIECGLCVSACPASRPIGDAADHGGFAGPAALAMADRDREERPFRLAAVLAFASGPRGVAACERAFACSRACPQGVAPGRRIEALRKALATPPPD